MFLVWLGEQITSRGVGNGSSLIIFAGIVARLPEAVVQTFELGRQGSISTGLVIGVIVMAMVVICLHRVHGARAAARADHLSQASGRQ